MRDKKKIIGFVTLGLVLLILIICILLLFSSSETHTSTVKDADEISALYCKAGKLENAFFDSDAANTIKHEIKLTFKNATLDKIYYSFKGTYPSEDTAAADETRLHAKYNIYMGDNGVDQGSLSPNYSVVKAKFKLSMYVDSLDKINTITAKLFFINKEDLQGFGSNSMDDLKSYYENQSFQCESIK